MSKFKEPIGIRIHLPLTYQDDYKLESILKKTGGTKISAIRRAISLYQWLVANYNQDSDVLVVRKPDGSEKTIVIL
jgi:hypothetical protein